VAPGFIGAAARRGALEERADSSRWRRILRPVLYRPDSLPQASQCPEIDCLRTLLPQSVLVAAETRALSIGEGADRVLICANAISEEAYLSALAASLGTSYVRLEQVTRAQCPLDNADLIRAAVTGLLPLNQDGKTIWIIAPQSLIARHLANSGQADGQLPPFWLTSSEQICQFVARYTTKTLGRQAADGLRRTQPLLSSAPRPRVWRSFLITTLLIFAVAALPLVSAAAIKTVGTLLCAVFLAAAALRLWSAMCARPAPRRSIRVDDDRLPIYTIICALYREANVVSDLVAAIRALDYPGIMAQTPLNRVI
jgi:glycosyltransferase XagB